MHTSKKGGAKASSSHGEGSSVKVRGRTGFLSQRSEGVNSANF